MQPSWQLTNVIINNYKQRRYKMCFGEFLLGLKANRELFNFIQQALLLLLFSSSVISYFAFKGGSEYSSLPEKLRILAYVMWTLSFFILLIVITSYAQERKYNSTRNAWGETIYEQKRKTQRRNDTKSHFVTIHKK